MRSEFAVHMLNADGKAGASNLANIFSDALNAIENVVGKEGRELAIVRTKLEEAAFFAKKALAVLPQNQE